MTPAMPSLPAFSRKMILAIEVLRSLDPNLPPTFIQVFFAIAEGDQDKGIETRTLPERLDLAQSSINRAVTYLGERHWKTPDRPGLFLIDVTLDRYDRRQRIAKLTAKGRKVIEQVQEILYG